jgi:hypothetical protein
VTTHLVFARHLRLWSVATLLTAALGCQSPSSEADCESTCERLDACGFLPSPIAPQLGGTDLLESCKERCIASDPDLVEEMHSCAAVVRPESQALWCTARNGKDSPCQQAATCMQQLVAPDFPITGEVALRLEARTGASAESAPQTQTPLAACLAAEPSEEDGATMLALSPLCDHIGVDEIEYFVQQGGTEQPAKHYPCAAGLERGAEFTLKPGPVIAGVRLQGTIHVEVEQDAGTTQTEPRPGCITYYAGASILRAGTDVKLPIYLPQSGRPPLTEDACP